MNEEDLDQIREIVRSELHLVLEHLSALNQRARVESPREPLGTEIDRLQFLNDRLAMAIDAGPLMKGCKYDKAAVSAIAKDVSQIKRKV